ncbi:mitochondrial ribosomal protein [Delitschia confertaspora ATCC 74209]|uniref:37S ribosomal protein S25, mitochondrial n=1 Tax=Delitschia confertaspora ATCC 74209 TaxID=1513339 RepID=A0A9P4JJ09_9PLEO|nr:mitochondrial ribosomal protein [Delitschia confertaspora ATCC 74209]
MGRYDFRALRVRQNAKALVDSKRNPALPLWYNIVGDIPPSETLARPVLRAPRPKGNSKPSRMFQPLPIVYPEDRLRKDFFGDHPWELARPRIILEDSGNDAKGYDWSRIEQPGKPLDGESVVQRQLWLMQHEKLPKAQAYDKARREFYRHRHLEAVKRRVAKEEALSTGAYFGKGPLEVGMELEDQAFEHWRNWATQQIETEQANRAQMMSGPQNETQELSEGELDLAVEEVAESIPATNEGKSALGGAMLHP